VAGYTARWLTRPQMVTHPSTNRAQRRVTTLIETNVLQLSHAITCQFNAGMYETLR